jgi:hypothetical protein
LLGKLVELQHRQLEIFIKEFIGNVDQPKIFVGIGMAVGTLVMDESDLGFLTMEPWKVF